MKKIYGIGAGPGDGEYITLKGYKLIRKADMVFIPSSGGKSFAGNIAKDYISDKQVVELDFAMDGNEKGKYAAIARLIDDKLKSGQTGVFLTLGDPMVYSTFCYFMEELVKLGIQVETVPGVTSFCAAANRAKVPVALKGESFYLCDGDIDEEILKAADSVCILKTYKNKASILNALEKHGFEYVYVKRCTCDEEKVLYERDEILKDTDYMSLIMGRRKTV
ncbi:MAG: precorrin-2 C(20)-methyltransferase [Firmicutes bacterium]|nr:precorrin-2 C(20)-methyltransferase [Bacillota bacterium]